MIRPGGTIGSKILCDNVGSESSVFTEKTALIPIETSLKKTPSTNRNNPLQAIPVQHQIRNEIIGVNNNNNKHRLRNEAFKYTATQYTADMPVKNRDMAGNPLIGAPGEATVDSYRRNRQISFQTQQFLSSKPRASKDSSLLPPIQKKKRKRNNENESDSSSSDGGGNSSSHDDCRRRTPTTGADQTIAQAQKRQSPPPPATAAVSKPLYWSKKSGNATPGLQLNKQSPVATEEAAAAPKQPTRPISNLFGQDVAACCLSSSYR